MPDSYVLHVYIVIISIHTNFTQTIICIGLNKQIAFTHDYTRVAAVSIPKVVMQSRQSSYEQWIRIPIKHEII